MNAQLPLTDAQVRGAIARRAAADLPPDLRGSVLTAVAAASQRRSWAVVPTDAFWRHSNARAFLALAAIALLVAASLVIVGAWFHDVPLPRPAGLPAIVLEQWNGLEAESSRVAHLAFPPSADAGTPVSVRLPANALSLRWSPDGERLAYITAEDRPSREPRHGLVGTGLLVARADGGDPVAVSLPRFLEQYGVSSGWDVGAKWAPGGELFAIPWSTHSCTGGPYCIPPSGIDVFDAAGNLVKSIELVDGDFGQAIWSPDGLALGWFTGACGEGWCATDAFHWQRVHGDSRVITILLENASVTWSTDGLLHGVSVHLDPTKIGNGIYLNETVGSVFTIRSDGTDLRDLSWTTDHPELIPRWSPDGRHLATVDYKARSLMIHDANTGRDVVVSLPAVLDIAAWAPDGGRIVLFGGVEDRRSVFAFYAVNADGTGFVSLGEGEDFAWAPRAMLPAP